MKLSVLAYFPLPWKNAHTILLPKPNKNLTNPINYRPISLLSALGKVFEKILDRRIRIYLEDNKYFSPFQSGFRAHKSTINPIARITESIKLGFKRKSHTVALFLDAEKAFDKTWHNGLKYKLLKYKFPDNITRILSSFLNNRQMQIFYNGLHSDPFTLQAGTPQGSVLSPLLYSLYVNDLPTSNLPPPALANLLMTLPFGIPAKVSQTL